MTFPLVWRETLEREATARIQVEDRNRQLCAQVEDLHEQLVAALRDGNAAREQVANWICQYTFGQQVFGPLALPAQTPAPVDETPMPRRRHGRELVAQAERELYETMAAQRIEESLQ